MKQISKGEGPEQYTLHFPWRQAPSAKPLDTAILVVEIEAALHCHVEAGQGSGWEHLRLGPFEHVSGAEQAFQLLVHRFALLAVAHEHPIYFERELSPPDTQLAGFHVGKRVIDGVAFLAYPVIIPEHQMVMDSGMMLAQRVHQISDDKIKAAFAINVPTSEPLALKVGLALDSYIGACAAAHIAHKFLGLTTALEVLTEPAQRPQPEIDALDEISAALGELDIAKKSQVHQKMMKHVLDKFGQFKETNKTARLKILVEKHANAILYHLPGDHPNRSNLSNGVDALYSMRSRIAHSGSMGNNSEHIHRVMQFASAATKAILLASICTNESA